LAVAPAITWGPTPTTVAIENNTEVTFVSYAIFSVIFSFVTVVEMM
jgi:hypothetical protein